MNEQRVERLVNLVRYLGGYLESQRSKEEALERAPFINDNNTFARKYGGAGFTYNGLLVRAKGQKREEAIKLYREAGDIGPHDIIDWEHVISPERSDYDNDGVLKSITGLQYTIIKGQTERFWEAASVYTPEE